MNMHVPAAIARKPSELVEEYERKDKDIAGALEDFEKAGNAIKLATTIGGTWGDTSIDTGRVHESQLRKALLSSAWRHTYKVLRIDTLATPNEKKAFEQSMADPAPFTLENIRATFGKYIADPRGSILRAFAEVFCELDRAYKSHDKVAVGVKGLPKRIILPGIDSYSSWRRDRLEATLNAIAVYQGRPLVSWAEISKLLEDETALLASRGVTLRRFKNGNGHLFFEPGTLRDINKALAEFYGEVLPDCHESRPEKKRPGSAVSKDLQYYPTPEAVAEDVASDAHIAKGQRVLEPSCGCGRLLDALRKRGARCVGVEVDPGRANLARAKGHSVITGNFLETTPTADFDHVVMNPPFYGKHYARHVEHALGFLKPGGRLTAILPITARHDHGIITDAWAKERRAFLPRWGHEWRDLPLGSFAESGTNINTTVLTLWKED